MIVSYAVRSILAQRAGSAVTLVVLASSAAIITVLFGLVEGVMATVREGGEPSVAVVITEGGEDTYGPISRAAIDRMRVVDGVARNASGPLVSPEIVANVPFMNPDGSMNEVRIRGVDQVAFAVHKLVSVQGRFPANFEPGVVVGADMLRRHEDLHVGGMFRYADKTWPILGVLDSANTLFASEVWCDRGLLAQLLKLDDATVVYAQLDSPQNQASFASAVAAMKGEDLSASSESAYYEARATSEPVYFQAIYVILIILALSITFVTANTIHTSFLARLREVATLMAIGYTRARVVLMITLESVILTLTGACCGAALGFVANGHRVFIEATSLTFAIHISPRVVGLGLLVVGASGVLASIVTNVQIFRVNVLDALRE